MLLSKEVDTMPSVRDQQLAKIIGTNIARKLIEQDKTQMDIVNDLGFSKSTVSSWVNGSRMPLKGKLLLIGAEDDVLWDTAKYIRRMQARLESKPHECEPVYMVYEHGTHFVFPESMMKTILPVGSMLFVGLFRAGKEHKEECRQTRIDIDNKVCAAIEGWAKGGMIKSKTGAM
jgi:transcriptional regulator with XRE-family HTH domain